MTITNHGPDQLDSATVVVQLDLPFSAAIATRTASTPTDPNGANDSDPTSCSYQRPK